MMPAWWRAKRMHDDTTNAQRQILDALDDDFDVTAMNIIEYVSGDPTKDDSVVTGAEIEMTVFVSIEDDDSDDNPYRVK